jgi:hypothetical protein
MVETKAANYSMELTRASRFGQSEFLSTGRLARAALPGRSALTPMPTVGIVGA